MALSPYKSFIISPIEIYPLNLATLWAIIAGIQSNEMILPNNTNEETAPY